MFKIYSIITTVAPKKYKGECIYILNKRIKYYTKEMCKLIKIVLFSLILVITTLFIKYKPAYLVTISGENIGYVSNKQEIEDAINEYVSNKEGCIVDVSIAEKPSYQFAFIDSNTQTSEEQILSTIQDCTITTYRMFAIKLNGETQDYVESLEEAENVVASIKEEYENKIDLDLSIEEIYTNESFNIVELETAKAEIGEVYNTKIQEMKENEALEKKKSLSTYTSRSINASRISKETLDLGVVTLIEPISGIITSKFASISSIRTSAHKGLDIAAQRGTKIKAAETGIVTFAGTDNYLR